MRLYILLLFCIFCTQINARKHVIDDITDIKDFKKLLKTKNNVMVLYFSNARDAKSEIKVFENSATLIKGFGTMVIMDCSHADMKKICKKNKVTPTPATLKHYKGGDFHKDYDRRLSITSLVTFMKEPAGDIPWEEDSTATDIVHIQDSTSLGKFLKKETKPIMVMFYAPWCGYCKQMKPDYAEAATELKKTHILAAIDVNRPENSVVRKQYNISGFPTLLYFEYGELQSTYEGENNKDAIVGFMRNPKAPPVKKPKEADWAAEANSEIVHLTATSFEPALKDEASVLVMFYAPWCGHCKRMKPKYEKAAEAMKEQQISGVLAALDATKEGEIATKYGVKGYPTVKYFVNGEFKFDVNVRDTDAILEFMKNPSEPPPPPPPEKEWSDEPSNVVHLDDESFKGFLKKKKHVLVMFYAPWCGHCKKAKPELVTAAEHFKDDPRVELAAVDCTKHGALCSSYSVKGYPTIKYFSFLKTMNEYIGGRTSADFIKYLSKPEEPTPPVQDASSSFGTYPGSDSISILSDSNFTAELGKASRAIVMFYAPWCSHCTKMKPAYSLAGQRLITDNIGIAAAIDATVHPNTAASLNVKGYPTLKYFENGKYIKDYEGQRTTEAIYNFVKNGGKERDEL